MHALVESDYAVLTYILHFFALCRGPKWGHGNSPTRNTSLDVHVLMVTAYKSQLETIQQDSVFKKCGLLILIFDKKFYL